MTLFTGNGIIFHPEHGLNEKDRAQAWKATIVLGIFTLGTAHAATGLYHIGRYLWNRCIVKEKTETNLSNDLPQPTPYCNMGSVEEVESRELSLKSETDFSNCFGYNSTH